MDTDRDDYDAAESQVRLDVGGWISGPCLDGPVTEDELAEIMGRMEQCTLTLAEFQAARLDEDYAAAMAATGTAWAWEATGDKDNSWAVGYVESEDGSPLSGEIEHGQGIVIDGVCESINGHLPDAAHIARHHPARVLRQVEAARARLALLAEAEAEAAKLNADEHASRFDQAMAAGRVLAATAAVKHDAAVHSSHPDYREEWKP